MEIVKYVMVDAKDGKPTTQHAARHGMVDSFKVEQVLTLTVERHKNGYDHAIIIGATNANLDGNEAVIKIFNEAEKAELLQQLQEAKMEELNYNYERACDQLKLGYPKSEVDSWTEQKLEAAKYRAGETDTPWLDNAVVERGITKEELVTMIEANALMFSQVHGSLSGKRQANRDLVANENDLIKLARMQCNFDIGEVFNQ